MSKLMENKQAVHIVSEILVLLGLTFYFDQKYKKLAGHMEDLTQRIEEQEDLTQKQGQAIEKLVGFINSQRAEDRRLSRTAVRRRAPAPGRRPVPVPVPAPAPMPVMTPMPVPGRGPVPAAVPPQAAQEHPSSDEGEDESDLDAELAEELGELEEPGEPGASVPEVPV